MLKQESDFTFSLQFYKDEKKTDAKGAIFMDLAVEAKPVSTNNCMLLYSSIQQCYKHNTYWERFSRISQLLNQSPFPISLLYLHCIFLHDCAVSSSK